MTDLTGQTQTNAGPAVSQASLSLQRDTAPQRPQPFQRLRQPSETFPAEVQTHWTRSERAARLESPAPQRRASRARGRAAPRQRPL